MADDKDLHDRLETLEKRLAAARGELASMSDQKRASLESLLERLSEVMAGDDEDER